MDFSAFLMAIAAVAFANPFTPSRQIDGQKTFEAQGSQQIPDASFP
jgi:hypothetical protein